MTAEPVIKEPIAAVALKLVVNKSVKAKISSKFPKKQTVTTRIITFLVG